MRIGSQIKALIEKNINLIDNHQYDDLYRFTPDGLKPELTETLLACDIDPLNYLTSIPEYYRSEDLSLKEIIIPDNIQAIGRCAFWKCNALRAVQLSKNTAYIYPNAFRSCSYLNKVQFNEGLSTIGEGAFSYCVSLNNIELPDSLLTIEANAFLSSGVQNIVLPNNLETILDQAFGSCKNLVSVRIPASIKKIGELVFHGCTNLKTIYVEGKLSDTIKRKLTFGNNAIIEEI